MTSTIVYVTENAAHLLTDGAMFGPAGEVVALKQKAIILAHQNAVAAARGPDMFAGLLAVVLGQLQGGFDEVAAGFPEACRRAHYGVLAAARSGTAILGDPALVDAVLVGLSERHGFIGYAVSSYDEADGLAFTAKPLRGQSALAYASPFDAKMIESLEGRGVDVWAETVNVEKHGLEVMREQRASSDIVGGFCQLTTVMRSGVFASVLEQWDQEAK